MRRDGDQGLLSQLRRTNRNGSTNAIPFGEPNSVMLGDRSCSLWGQLWLPFVTDQLSGEIGRGIPARPPRSS